MADNQRVGVVTTSLAEAKVLLQSFIVFVCEWLNPL